MDTAGRPICKRRCYCETIGCSYVDEKEFSVPRPEFYEEEIISPEDKKAFYDKTFRSNL